MITSEKNINLNHEMNTNEKQLPELPETIGAGDEVEVQIAPFGDWPNVDADGNPLTQSVDGEAVDRMVANFAGNILVDADHQSESGGSTEALAWVTALRADPERGLVGTMRFTDVILGFFALERNGNGVCQHFSCPICPISVVRAMWSTRLMGTGSENLSNI